MKTLIAIGVLAIGCSALPAAAPALTNSTAAPAASAPAAKDAKADEVIAKGKGVEIKRSQLDEAMSTIVSSLRGQEIPPERLQGIRGQLFERLLAMQLLAAKATDADKAKANENTQKRIEELKKNAGGQEALEMQLKTHKLTLKELESKIHEEAIAEAVLEREANVSISDQDAKKFYDENPARFEQPEMVRAAHILLMTQDLSGKPLPEEKKKEKLKQIEDLLKRARAGEDFATLAKQYSEDPGSKDKGGEYTFPRGQMVPEFEKAAFALKTNEVSDVVTTQYGYHIIKLYEKIPAKKVPYEEVASKLKDALKAQALQKDMPAYVEKLQKEAGVQILDESLKPKPMPEMAGPGSAKPGASAPAVTQEKKPDTKAK